MEIFLFYNSSNQKQFTQIMLSFWKVSDVLQYNVSLNDNFFTKSSLIDYYLQ